MESLKVRAGKLGPKALVLSQPAIVTRGKRSANDCQLACSLAVVGLSRSEGRARARLGYVLQAPFAYLLPFYPSLSAPRAAETSPKGVAAAGNSRVARHG